MASRGTLVLLVAFAVVAGGLMKGVNGEASFVRRRLAGHSLGARADAIGPATNCPIICGAPVNPSFPNCCVNMAPPFPPLYFCANTQVDVYNCGVCGNSCSPEVFPVGVECCAGTCIHTLTDANNCGSCGSKCPALETCHGGMCSSYVG